MDMQEELLDRYGDLPHAVNNLLNIALIKSKCNKVYIQDWFIRIMMLSLLCIQRPS